MKYKIYLKIPRWIRPLDIATELLWIERSQNKIYGELIDDNSDLWPKEILERKDIYLDW